MRRADIHELVHLNSTHAGMEFSLRGQRVFDRIERSRKPVLAAINGTCVGGGLELALACHIRIAAQGVKLGVPETKLGLIPGFGGTQRLPRVVGPSRAAEMILTGESISAEEAFRIGLVNRVFPVSQVLAQTEALAGLIASRSTTAVQAALHAISGGLGSACPSDKAEGDPAGSTAPAAAVPRLAAKGSDRSAAPSERFPLAALPKAEMEATGFEPVTPCLQSRCSTS